MFYAVTQPQNWGCRECRWYESIDSSKTSRTLKGSVPGNHRQAV